MAYDGFYSDLSTRASANDILDTVIEARDQVLAAEDNVEVLAAQADLDATAANNSAGAAALSAANALVSETNAAASAVGLADAVLAADASADAALASANAADASADAAAVSEANAASAVTTGINNFKTDLANATDPLKGATYVGYKTGQNVRQALDKLFNDSVTYSIKTYGAVCDGVTDDGPAIRLALDAVATTGGTVDFPQGAQVKVVGTVFIPQRIDPATVNARGIRLRGNDCTIIGDGSSTIFESGTGTKSTVALGGASNWPLGNELSTTIHYNSAITGFNFRSFGTAMKLKNWIQGCVVQQCYGSDFSGSLLWTNRSFYLGQYDLTGRPFQSSRADTTAIFRHDGFNNTMAMAGIHGSGIGPDTFTHGTGILFDGGTEGQTLNNGISFEACKVGIELKSIVYSLDINGVYFEVCDTAIKSTGANLNHLNIDNCRFNAVSTNLNVDNWVSGEFGPGNDTQSGIVTFGIGCTNTVHLPALSLSELNHTTWVAKPANWTINAGCQVRRNEMIFNSGVGFSSIWFRNNPNSSGLSGIVPKSYTGDCFNVGGTIPYCTVSGVGTGTLTITTKIAWNPNLAAVRFDLLVNHSSAAVIAGVLSANNTVFRDDAVAGITITPSDSGGFLRFTMSGFGTITSVSGQVRVI
jgi:hypothetical protein